MPEQLQHPEHAQQVTVADDGRLVASAELLTDTQLRILRAQLHVEAGHQRPGTGGRLVDAVLARAESEHAVRLVASFPAGEAEVLERLRERCPDLRARAAGATVIAEASLSES